MALRHKQATFYTGDTWKIRGQLKNGDGLPFPLPSGALVEWVLIDETRTEIKRASTADGGIAVADHTNGLIDITVDAATTDGITCGLYSDALRTTIAGVVCTMWVGPIVVDASPFV